MRIDKNVPIPPNGSGGKKRGAKGKYQWDKIAVGDSFVIKKKEHNTMYASAKRAGVKVVIRAVDEKNIRVWRVAAEEKQEEKKDPTSGFSVACCHKCAEGKSHPYMEGFPLSASGYILCKECGNKRCPKATDHDLACTGSNEPGQEGSVYK